jgi:tellurite resistance protein
LKIGDRYMVARAQTYADQDGDLTALASLARKNGRVVAEAFIPFIAIPEPLPSRCAVEMLAVDGGGAIRGGTHWNIELPQQQRDANSFTALIRAAAALCHMTGGVKNVEAQALVACLRDMAELDELGRVAAAEELAACAERLPQPDEFMPVLRASPQSAGVFIQVLATVARADGDLQQSEVEFLMTVGRALNLSPDELREFGVDSTVHLNAHFKVLELEPGASLVEVKKAYRRLAAEYHPDKAATLPKGFRAFAEQRMKELNLAYDTLREALER